MLLKKNMLVAAAIAICTLPAIANADLVTVNGTNEASAVTVTSGAFKGQCSGNVPEKVRAITPANSTRAVAWKNVQALCFQSGDTCTADIHMTANCTDAPVAHASLNMKNPEVTILVPLLNPHYNVTASGTTVNIEYGPRG